MNTSIIIGRLTDTPELKRTNTGKSVTSFCVAARRTKEIADYIDVVAWEQRAEFICGNFEKGQPIAIRGHITSRNYEDKNGNKRKAVEVVADEVQFAGNKAGETKANPAPYVAPTTNFSELPEDDDLPF